MLIRFLNSLVLTIRNYENGTFPNLQLWYVEVSWDGGLDEISGCASNPRYNFGHWSIMSYQNSEMNWQKLWTLLEMVFCYQNCSDLLWEKIVRGKLLKFEGEGWIFKIFEFTRTIHSNRERWEQLLVTECFFNLFLEVSQI